MIDTEGSGASVHDGAEATANRQFAKDIAASRTITTPAEEQLKGLGLEAAAQQPTSPLLKLFESRIGPDKPYKNLTELQTDWLEWGRRWDRGIMPEDLNTLGVKLFGKPEANSGQ